MKKGKELKLQKFKNYNVVYGSVNNKNPKALYINVSAWAEPKSDSELSYNRIIRNSDKRVRQIIFNLLEESIKDIFYNERTIVDFDMRESGIKYGKKSFVNCEITLYLKQEIPVNSDELKPVIDGLIDNIINICFEQNKYFIFHKKKK